MQLTKQQESAIAGGARLIATVMDPQPKANPRVVIYPYLKRIVARWNEMEFVEYESECPFWLAEPVPGFPGLAFGESQAVRLIDGLSNEEFERLHWAAAIHWDEEILAAMIGVELDTWLWLTEIVEGK